MYINKLDDTGNEYNNTYQSTIKVKFVYVKSSIYIDFGKENNKKDPKFKFRDHVRISTVKTFLQKITFQIGPRKFLWLKKLKILFCGNKLLVI